MKWSARTGTQTRLIFNDNVQWVLNEQYTDCSLYITVYSDYMNAQMKSCHDNDDIDGVNTYKYLY